MLFYKLLLTRFIAMYMLLLMTACSVRTVLPGGSEWQDPASTALWETISPQATASAIGTPAPGIYATNPSPSGSPPAPQSTAIQTGSASQATPSLAVSIPTGAPASSGTPAAAVQGMPPSAVAARQWLAEQLDAAPDQIVIQNFERVQWPDTCLGVSQPGVSCAQVITPGWRVVLYAGGQNYEVRVDDTARIFRLLEGGKT